MNVSEQIDLLALRLEDPAKGKFTDIFKQKALGNAQVKLASLLHNDYLTELQSIKTSVTAGSGVTALLNTALLDYEVLRGAEGIINVKDATSGTYCTQITLDEAKKLENSFLSGSVYNPIYWVYQNKIYVRPTSVVSLDIAFLRQPAPLRYKFQSDEAAIPSTTEFDGAAGESLSSVNDTYNGAVIYNTTKQSYHVVTDYVGAGLNFTVGPAADANFISVQYFYFITDGLELLNIGSVTTELNESLHELMITFAEAESWAMSGDLERRAAAMKAGYDEVKILNDRYKGAEGIGTKGNRG